MRPILVSIYILSGCILWIRVILWIRKKRKTKKQKIEELENSNAYALVLKIKGELEKKGYHLNDLPNISFDHGNAGGYFQIYNSSTDMLGEICYTPYHAHYVKSHARHNLRMANASGRDRLYGRFYGIENANIGVLVTSEKASEDMPEYIKIAAEVIENSGFGSCTQIE